MLTHDSTDKIRIEGMWRARLRAVTCCSVVKHEKRALEELPCAFRREFCTD
jgi:hypothetical protein